MCKKIRFLLLALVALSFSSCGQTEFKGDPTAYASICLIDFDMESIADVGMDYFGGKCLPFGKLSGADKQYEEISSYIKSAQPHSFEDSKIRAEITFSDGRVVYVNQMGELKVFGKSSKFREDDFLSFKRIMKKMWDVAETNRIEEMRSREH
jgi:hypothetical protein